MPSEGNRGPGIGRANVVLLALMALWLIGIELFAAYGFPRLSRTHGRLVDEYRSAIARRASDPPPPPVLIVGNSLLAAGLDLSIVGPALQPRWKLNRLVVESTTYVDWYFGLRRLFSDGARPAAVIFMLHWRQLAATSVRGEYFAHYLMDTADFLRVVRALQMHPTPASALLAGHWSAFYGTRIEIRKNVLGRLVPGLEALTSLILERQHGQGPDEGFEELVAERLGAVKRFCDEHGARFVFVVAPTLDETYSGTIQSVAAPLGVEVIPAPSRSELEPSDFSDGFHLNEVAARKYSVRFAAMLGERLETSRAGPPVTRVSGGDP